MITKNNAAVPGESVSAEDDSQQLATRAVGKGHVRPVLWRLGAVALIAGVAFSQSVMPLQIIPLAPPGTDSEHNVILHMKGATDVLQAELIFQPGGSAGWHIHPGPVVVVVKSGKLTEIHSSGCKTVHDTGSAFFEQPGEVHNVLNEGNVALDIYATFLSPSGSQPLIPVGDPGNVCRN